MVRQMGTSVSSSTSHKGKAGHQAFEMILEQYPTHAISDPAYPEGALVLPQKGDRVVVGQQRVRRTVTNHRRGT